MSKEYLDRKEVINIPHERDKDGRYIISKEVFENIIKSICQLKPKNQVKLEEENKLLKGILKPLINIGDDGWFAFNKVLTAEEIELIYKIVK